MLNKIYYSLFLLSLAIFFSQCNNSSDNKPTLNSYLVSSSLIEETSLSEVTSFAKLYSNNLNSDIVRNPEKYLKYDVEVRKIIYNSKNIYGKSVLASGVLIIPISVPSDKNLYALNILHSSIPDRNLAPSKYVSGQPLFKRIDIGFGKALASMGLMVVIPDYIGYGNTEDELHPYEDVACVQSCLDIMYATQDYAKTNNIKINNQWVLTGYSQGAFNALATHKYIQDNNISSIKILKTIAGSGAYDKLEFSKEVLKQDKPLVFLPFYLWVLNTYQKMYAPLNYATMMNQAYYTAFANINYDFSFGLYGKVGEDLVNGYLPILDQANLSSLNPDFINPQKLFTSSFLYQLSTESTALEPFWNALRKNTIINWAPIDSVKLVYGTLDSFVYPLNSINAEAKMKSSGSNKVQLIKSMNTDHTTTAFATYYPILLGDMAVIASQ